MIEIEDFCGAKKVQDCKGCGNQSNCQRYKEWKNSWIKYAAKICSVMFGCE